MSFEAEMDTSNNNTSQWPAPQLAAAGWGNVNNNNNNFLPMAQNGDCGTSNQHIMMDINLNGANMLYQAFPHDIKGFNICGTPMVSTIECDYKTININGEGHRIVVQGICNSVTINGSGHVIGFDGFTNSVFFVNTNPGAEITVMGNPLSYVIRMSSGKVNRDGPIHPVKITFPAELEESKRHRFICVPAPGSALAFPQLYPPAPTGTGQLVNQGQTQTSYF